MMEWLIAIQRAIHGVIASDLNAFAASRNWMALMFVLPLGVVFGAVHALTPGHGKSVLAAYLAGSRIAFLRGLIVACTLALTHVGMAVMIAVFALPFVSRQIGSAGSAPFLEILSRSILILIGIWFVLRAWSRSETAHRHDGPMVGVVAGLVPCPLTLFAMFYAISRGIPEAGLVFAAAMAIGIIATLSVVAAATVVLRDQASSVFQRYSGSAGHVTCVLEGLSGVALILIGAAQIIA